MGEALVAADEDMEGFWDKNNIRQLFVALADQCLDGTSGVLAMINPTIALTTTSGQQERILLAQRFHVHTIVTCHQPNNINLSQHTNINESILVLKRHRGPKPPTRFVNLDRFPVDDSEVAELHRCLQESGTGVVADGWGEVFEWPAHRIEAGDWTMGIWRSKKLAEAAALFAGHPNLVTVSDVGLSTYDTGRRLREFCVSSTAGEKGSFPIIKSKGADGQQRIEATPDGYCAPKTQPGTNRQSSQPGRLLREAGHLLITAGQDNSTARLTAVATDEKYVGNGWMPVPGLGPEEAKAAAVFINSTPGRLQLMRNPSKKLAFPTYSRTEAANLRIPDLQNRRIRKILATCWEQTRDIPVPQFRDGECEVRQLWDDAVCDALGWDKEQLAVLRNLLHREPHVRGLGYNQYGDAPETDT